MRCWRRYGYYLPVVLAVCSMVFHQRERSVQLPGWAKLFGQYTGTCTGYGFFGPRVGSIYIVEVDCYDEAGRLMAQLSIPPLTHAEGQKRYHTFLDVFAALVGDEPTGNEEEVRYARAVAQCLARRLAASHGLSPRHLRYKVSASSIPHTDQAFGSYRFIPLYEHAYTYPPGS